MAQSLTVLVSSSIFFWAGDALSCIPEGERKLSFSFSLFTFDDYHSSLRKNCHFSLLAPYKKTLFEKRLDQNRPEFLMGC